MLNGLNAASVVSFVRPRTVVLKPVTRRLLLRAAEVYAEQFALPDGRIPATFEIITLTAWVPHENQQKPLQPGSAKMRLSEALGVAEQTAGEGVPFNPKDRAAKE